MPIPHRVKNMLAAAAILAGTLQPAHASVTGNRGLNGRLNAMLIAISNHFRAPVTVVSGCRTHAHNRRIGGARDSYHLRCMAADIRVAGVGKGSVYKFAAGMSGRGGVGTYCRSDFIHVDVGNRREWHWGCGSNRRSRTTNVIPASGVIGNIHYHIRSKAARHHKR